MQNLPRNTKSEVALNLVARVLLICEDERTIPLAEKLMSLIALNYSLYIRLSICIFILCLSIYCTYYLYCLFVCYPILEEIEYLLLSYEDSTTPLIPKSEISNLVAVQSTLSRTWSETPKTGFLMMRLIIFASVILEAEMLLILRPISEKFMILFIVYYIG